MRSFWDRLWPRSFTPAPKAIERILVVGATGGVGQLVVAQLLQKGYAVRVLVRGAEKAQRLFGERVEIAIGNLLQPNSLPPALEKITAVICSTGSTAFPSARWEFELPDGLSVLARWQAWFKLYTNETYRRQVAKNAPFQVDGEGVSNLVKAIPATLKRLVLVSSCGVSRREQFPFKVLNGFGVLDAKLQAETAVISAAVPYTIVRPGRLIDGPYTSYDLNTLVKATTEGKLGVVVATGDRLVGQTSRIDVAAACVECLAYPETAGQAFEIFSEGKRPETIDWQGLFIRSC